MTTAGSLPGIEWRMLLEACAPGGNDEKLDRIPELLSGTVHWPSLLALAEQQGVQPLLHQALLPIQGKLPELWPALNAAYQSNVRKAMLLSRELIRVVDHLSQRGIAVLPYKGLALAQMLYGDIAMRQSGDIDLLVRARDVPHAKQALAEIGYQPHLNLSDAEERAYLKCGYERAFDGSAGSNLLEIQWAIQPSFYAVDYAMDGLFERAISLDVAGRPMNTPSLDDLFLVLSLHAAKHAWGRLIWLHDLARLMDQPLNWEWIAERARDLGVMRILNVTLLLIGNLFGGKRSESVPFSLAQDRIAQRLAEKIRANIISGNNYDVESLAYFRLMLKLRENAADKSRFVSRLAFTPGPGEWAAVRLPERLYPLYRLVRMSRLVSRLVRS